MKKQKIPFLLLGLLLCKLNPLLAQDDLLGQLDSLQESPEEVIATFKAGRIINGQSVEGAGEGELYLIISHRFGELDGGLGTFFGLDDANTMLSLEYGLSDQLQLGLQRSSFNKMLDGSVKYRFLHQRADESLPFSAALFLQASLNTTSYPEEAPVQPEFRHRGAYLVQLLIARKFGERFSLQLSPSYLHRNLVPLVEDHNDLPVLGVGTRYKLGKRVSLNLEYFHPFLDDESPVHPPIAVGFDIETGGHVFQLHVTNAREMTERGFMAETGGDFFRGDLHFGFNISRVFELGGGKKK